MTAEANRGPFCTVPRCIEPAEGAVVYAYVKQWRRALCAEHMRPISEELRKLMRERVPG